MADLTSKDVVVVKTENSIEPTPKVIQNDDPVCYQITDTKNLTNNDDNCFVCDANIDNKKCLRLSRTKTRTTRTPVVEKIQELMGDKYVNLSLLIISLEILFFVFFYS